MRAIRLPKTSVYFTSLHAGAVMCFGAFVMHAAPVRLHADRHCTLVLIVLHACPPYRLLTLSVACACGKYSLLITMQHRYAYTMKGTYVMAVYLSMKSRTLYV
jgi:hypothetical protein